MDFQKKPLGPDSRESVTQPSEAQPEHVVHPIDVKSVNYPRKRMLVWRIFIILLLLIATGLLVAGWFYVQDLYSQINTKDTEIANLHKNVKMPSSVTPGSGKDLMPQTEISSQALDTVEAYMTTKGVTRVQYDASIPYMDDDFARVRVDYLISKNKPSGKGEVFYFKRVERTPGVEKWAMIAINPTTPDETTAMKNRYGVTDGVITASKPQ